MVIFQRSIRRGSCSSLYRSPSPLYQATSASYWHRPIQPLPLTQTNETSGVYTSVNSFYGQCIPNHVTNTGTSSMIAIDWRREIGSLNFRNWLSSGFVTLFAFALIRYSFRLSPHIGIRSVQSSTAGDISMLYGVNYSKVRHPRQWQDSAITGVQRRKMIRRRTKVKNRL